VIAGSTLEAAGEPVTLGDVAGDGSGLALAADVGEDWGAALGAVRANAAVGIAAQAAAIARR